MTTVTPAIQINTSDAAINPQNNAISQLVGQQLVCPNGLAQNLDMVLAPSSSGIVPAFPNGATTSVFVYIFALTATDLIVKTGTGLVALPVLPYGMGYLFYGLTNVQISLNSVLGGRVSVVVGG